ncbi:hypothetical protein [uncultured Ferrimonas sp.]|uniref:hypothetical protein n=1 Tax=uncultured Ferrimonas sp. TaxID=432640 RepID=UPI0026211DCB|nr:hypothetical protein [uncultured Ferrimonas sp.]
MDSLPIANLLVSSLSALSSMVQAYNSSKVTKEDASKAEQRLDKPLKRGGAKVSQKIDGKLLSALSEKAEAEARKLIELVNMAEDPSSLELPMREASNRICFYLQQIKHHNDDVLPTKRLNDFWQSHRCVDMDVCNDR